ncbi:Uncharacterised protein [Legionella busanensis]|uniref:Uncharacterized protein n=1 Tax=Legionella busanensis TaxID=190655 RepID=A0A378JLJ4_9GAMM|nr:hypothetical protein [Legionella busanensis]STX50960.1 Uncharacterised protein [Legionella busanensis]
MNRIKRVFWEEVKNKVKIVNPAIYEVLEQLQLDNNIPFFLANYQFGAHFGVKNHAYLPTNSGQLAKIGSSAIDNELNTHLGYGKDSLPLGMILDKYCEWHYFGENERIFPEYVQGPGAIFNMKIIFDEDKTVDNNILSVSSGALSSYLLPNIGCARKHGQIQKYFKTTTPAPKSPYEHYQVFKEIIDNEGSSWCSEVLYFSKSFIDKVKNDEHWLKLKLYFSEALRKKIIRDTFDMSSNNLFLNAKKVNRFRPTPFIIDTAKYIFNICMGPGIGAKPANDEQYLPLKTIQHAYAECYGLVYTPTVMVPASLNGCKDMIYYPLQCPFTNINTFKSNQSKSTLTELETLKNVLHAYQEEFTAENSDAYGSPLYHLSKELKFTFYHYQANEQHSIRGPAELLEQDQRFLFSYSQNSTTFSADAKLFRGCVQLSR